jgi:penicillin-binding protein 1B
MTYRKNPAKSVRTQKLPRPGRKASAHRFRRLLFSPFVIAPLVIIALLGGGVMTYYYFRYTDLIDRGLRGDIFVRSSGIYAAPPELHTGGTMKQSELLAHLKRVGYLERGSTQNEKRGQYAVRGSTIEIYPGSDAIVDGAKMFRNLRVTFGRGGEGVQAINDLTSREQLERAPVEPELISSVVNQEREKRKIIEYKDLPQHLVDAIVVIEDRQFFEHNGINWRGIMRALVRDYQAGAFREGGSSITQQLVKNFWLKPEKSPKRKLAEAYISVLLEQRLTKEQIMAMYCNQIYLGQRGGFSINGFGQAARTYFDKDISHLTLAESAFLAGIIHTPNRYSSANHEERAKERRNLVLEKMVEEEKISRAEADRAKQTPLGIKGKGGGLDVSDAPYFIDYLTKQLETQIDDRTSALRALRIYSTLDLSLQRAAYQAVTKYMADVDKLLAKRKGGTAGLQAALVAMNPKTGEVLAMVGGRDYASSQLNRATEARRQPGSVFKPFVYAAALSSAHDDAAVITPATMFMDEPRTFEYGSGQEYSPGNFGDKYENKPMTLRDALVHSKNVITVEVAERIGLASIARLVEKSGLPRPPGYPSMALGVGEATPLQIASAYTMFANSGRRIAPMAIKRVTTATGSTLLSSKNESREVISPQVAYVMTSMMQDVIDRGTGGRVRQMGFKGTAAGKTGSSRDAWFAGYTPNLVCVVWVGFDDNSDIVLTGGVAAAPIWADFMIKALQLRPELGGEFTDPGDITTVDIDPATGMIAQGNIENARHELFIRGTEPNREPPAALDPEAPPAQPTEESTRPAVGPTPRPLATPTPRSIIGQQRGFALTGSSADGTLASTVTLEVCADTGLLPTDKLCKHTAQRAFTAGQEPRAFCSQARHDARKITSHREERPITLSQHVK